MSDEIDNIDKISASTKYKPLTPEQREKKQRRFLAVYRESGNIKHACKAAGISRQTFYEWRKTDEAFQAQLPDAQSDANDTLEQAAYERAVKGVPSFVVSNGMIVYEYEPSLDEETGEQKQDAKGKLLWKRGKPIIERKYSDTLLITLLKAHMPDKYKERQHTELVGLTELLDAEHASLLADLEALPDAPADQKPPEAGDPGADSASPR